MRLLMIYIIAFEGIQDMERRRLLENAKLGLDETQAINNLSIMGVKLSNPTSSKKESGKYSYWGSHSLDLKKKPDREVYDLSRYCPLIKRVMEDAIQNELPKSLFPWTSEPTQEIQQSTANAATKLFQNRSNKDALIPTDSSKPYSLRTTRPSNVLLSLIE